MSNGTCSIEGCERVVAARGWCIMHYKRFWKHGDPTIALRDTVGTDNCLVCGSPNKPGRTKYCSDACRRAAQREQIRQWKLDNPESVAAIQERTQQKRRRTRHNLPPDTVWPTHCEICGDEAELHVDHDHKCCPGKYSCGDCVSGFLCTNCNNGLGRFKDDPERLRSAARYLLRTRGVRLTDLIGQVLAEHPDEIAAAMARRDLK